MTTASNDTDGWSAAVGDLRGRVIVSRDPSAPRAFALDLELENLGATPLRVTAGDPFAVTATLEDAAGAPVAPSGSRIDVLSSPQTIELAARERRSQPLAARHDDVVADLDLTTEFWQLAPGRYRLTIRWRSDAPDGWTGELAPPPVTLEVP